MVTLSICSNLVCLQVCILLSAPKNSSFQSHPRPTYYQRKQHSKSWKLEINFSQGSAAALCRWGGQISNFVLHIIFVYSMPNIVEMYVCVCVCVVSKSTGWPADTCSTQWQVTGKPHSLPCSNHHCTRSVSQSAFQHCQTASVFLMLTITKTVVN